MQSDTNRFWLGWTFVTLVGYALGILVDLPSAVNLAYASQPPLVIGLISGAVLGLTIGLAQWLLLRLRTPVAIAWVGASIVGGMIGLALGMTIAESMAPVAASRDAMREAAASLIPWRVAWQTSLSGALFGLGLGVAQWWVLRQYARSAGWWVVVNTIGWMVGMGAGAALATIVTVLGAVLLTGLLGGAITGYTMERWQWEMRKRNGPIPGRT